MPTTTATGNYVCDNTTLPNWKSWCMAISNAFAAFGWVQTADTGQVVWTATVLTLTQVAVSGSDAVYSWASCMSVIITGFATGANNVTATLTAVSGGASGTVTVTKVSQANETHAGSGTTTAVAAVPASTYVYEIWAANDSQASTLPIYVKMNYGYATTTPRLQVFVGTGSNLAGTLTNALSGFNAAQTTFANGGATTYPCYFSGDAGEFRMMLWVTYNSNAQYALNIERSKDGTGAKTADYFTVIVLGSLTSVQQTCTGVSTAIAYENWPVAVTCGSGNRGTGFWNSSVAAFPFFPLLGTLGNPMLGLMACIAADVNDNATVTVATLYGGTHTYIASKGGTTTQIQNAARAQSNGNAGALLMRYE